MKQLAGPLVLLLTLSLFPPLLAQDILNNFTAEKAASPSNAAGHRIKDIIVFSRGSAVVFNRETLFSTDDAGETWSRMAPLSPGAEIASALFADKRNGIVLLAVDAAAAKFELARTADGGATWQRKPIVLEDAADYEVYAADARLSGSVNGTIEITAPLPTSSNFTGKAVYRSTDAGSTWQLVSRSIELAGNEEASARTEKGAWTLETMGECFGNKSGCVQETKLFTGGREVTPPELKALQTLDRESARADAARQELSAVSPGGSTRTSLNRGFDKCQAGSVAQMQLWWDNSYFFDSNIYFSGRNRACPSQPFTTAPTWIDQVSAMGWGLIPTVVGYQSPCTASATTAKFSYDPVTAESQGRGEADIAAADAAHIGLTAGSVIYYDMERYDETAATAGCRTATVAFLKGWTERIHELGYVSGTYGSPKNVIEDWQTMPAFSRMDAIWMARWDNVPSVWTYVTFPTFPNNLWNNHQRIKQWQAPHNETWAGVTFNIDGNISDGPVAGVPVPRNKTADFDGDGRTDISVFRPGTGQWFVAGSFGPSFSIYEYGTAEDILTPGDYDGDGKTDLAVFRPSNSTWYLRTKGSFAVRQYGQAGDVPAPADYNGDGRTDVAVFRPSTGVWYIALSDSLSSFVQVSFGQNGDRPAAADYDGDGKADIAVWRPSDGNWHVLGSAGSYTVVTWGVSTDVPAQGDYDADGKTDYAVFRPGTGTWWILKSTEGIAVQQFGQDGDLPVTGDYDGDGRFDVSVFRPADHTWYLSQSQGGYVTRDFGAQGDSPVPAAYLPR